jgi:hypothetical protein
MEEMCEVRRLDWLKCHYMPNYLKIDPAFQKLIWGIHRQHGDLISLFFLKNKESRLKRKSNREIEKLQEKATRSLNLSANIVAVIKLRTR